MVVHIYRPARNAMQSGRRKSSAWVVEFPPAERPVIDPLMGWTGSGNVLGQLRVSFSTRQNAIDFVKEKGLDFLVFDPPESHFIPKDYALNFASHRKESWSH